MHRINYTKEQLIKAVEESFSIAQTINKIGMKLSGGNYQTIHKNIKELNLDTSHFTGKLWSKGKKLGCKLIDDYLSNKRKISSHSLKLKLIDAQILERHCSCCGLTHWLEGLIPIELHHKDGNKKNNNLDNLQILCPNCHAQTNNYTGKNKKHIRKHAKKLGIDIKKISKWSHKHRIK